MISPTTDERAEHIRKLFRRLAETLKRIQARPTAEAVHHLRTTVRRLETVLGAEERSGTKKLLKQLGRLRRRAGKVRDLDVQLLALRSIHVQVSRRDLAILERQLMKTHSKRERRLQAAVEAELSEGLSRRMNRILKTVTAAGPRADSRKDYVAAALRKFQAVAQRYPEFKDQNLHEFRIRCKRVRYLAELGGTNPRSKLAITELTRIQDSVGEWHDWVALTATAEQVLSHTNSPLLSVLRAQRRLRLLAALRITLEARQTLLAMAGAAAGRRKPSATSQEQPDRLQGSAAVA